MTVRYQIEQLGDSAMMIRFGEEINEQVNGIVHAAAAYIEEQPFPDSLNVSGFYKSNRIL